MPYLIVMMSAALKGMSLSCAIKMAATASYRAVPSMLMVAPTGSTNRVTRGSIPRPSSRHFVVTARGGGGGALDFHVDGGGGAAGGRKPDPVAMRSVHKKYTLSQYTLLKICICIPCRNIAPSLVPRSRACHKHCGLGTPGKQTCDKRSSPPVAN